MNCAECGREFQQRNQSKLCSVECRFLAKVDLTDPNQCWEWTGSLESSGYGHMRVGTRTVKAHRVSYELIVGPIPDGLQIDHLCRNRTCVNPDHLEPVTGTENWLRGNQAGALALRTGLCGRGHSMDTAIIRSNGARACRACENERKRQYYRRMVQTNA